MTSRPEAANRGPSTRWTRGSGEGSFIVQEDSSGCISIHSKMGAFWGVPFIDANIYVHVSKVKQQDSYFILKQLSVVHFTNQITQDFKTNNLFQ